jgi:gliding motility-associated-like protein
MTVRGQTVAVASAFASNANICAGASTNLTANGTFGVPPYSVTWNPGGLAGSPVSVSPTVSTIYTAVVTDACGITSTQTVNVNVTPVTNPGFTISPNPVCVGDPVTVTGLGAGPATSYDWLLPSSSSPAVNNQQVLNGISYANPGTYSITLNYAQGTCVFPQTFNITVNPLPPLPIISSNGPVCEGDPINLDGPAIAGATYAWTGPNGFVSALEDPVISNATLSNSGTYQLTITVNGCSSPTANLNVVVNPLPALPVLGSNSPVCEGQTINLSSNNVPGGTYSWTGPNGFVSALEDPVINNATIGMSGTYNLSIALGTCVSPTANINIVVNPLPVINVSNTGPYCTASTIQLNAAGGTNYAWTGPGGFNSNLQNPVIANCSIANSGIYTVVVSDAAGCTASATTNVVVNSTLVVVPGSNSPLCAGDVLNLTCPAIAGGTYAWSGPNGFNSNLQNPTVNNAGNVNSGSYTINVTDANGCTGTANVNVVVNALPAANANNNSPVCAGDNVQLNASGGTVYSWSGPAGYINNNQNPIMAAVTTGMSGSYTVVVTDANNCSASASTNVVINPIPAGIASNNGPYCEGSNISLSVNTGSSFSWTGPAGFNSALQNPVINNSTAGMSGVYSVTVSDANNCSASFNTNVVVNALPNAGALNNGPFCEGNNIALSASGGNTYAWSGPNAYNSVLQNPVIPNCSVSDAGAYTVVVIDANNCSASAVTNVIVNTLPIANAGNNGPYCINNTINLNASGGISYSWVGPGGFNSVLQNPVLPNAALLNSGNYTVTVTDANGCTSTASTQVQVNATLNVVASYSGAACEGQSFTLDVTQVPAASYAWTGPNTYNSVLQSPTINNAQMNMAGVYSVTVSTPSGCTGTSTINVSVLAAPAPNAGNNGPLCAGANLLLNASGGNSYSWTGPNGFNSNLQNPAINNAGTNAAGTYQVLVTAASGCTAITGTQVVINPTPLINITGNTTICEGSTISLIATGGITCTWSTPSGSTQNGFNLNIGSATMSDAGNYSATVSDAIGCSSSQTVNITIQNGPDASFGSSVTTGCAPECIDFIALNPGNIVSYEWRSEGQVVATSSSPSICFPAEGLYDISLSAQAANGCINTMLLADYINMEARPLADFITDRSEAPDSDPVINFSNTSVGGSIFSWDFDDGSTENGTEVSHTFPGEGEYCVVLSATTLSGCSDEKEVCIKINPDFFIFIPNAFSPNGDGVNDKFEIKGTGVQEFELQIFDRWGGRLLSLNDFTTDWDGNVGGNSLAQGIYIYHLRVKSPSGKTKEYTGDITLIR